MRTVRPTLYALALFALFTPLLVKGQPADTIIQNWHRADRKEPTKDEALLKVKLLNAHNRLAPGIDLWVVHDHSGKAWYGRTDENGEVYFLLPKGEPFHIDAADVAGLRRFRTFDEKFSKSIISVEYIPNEFTEEVRNDTVFQKVSPAQAPTRSRVLTLLKVLDFDEKPLPGEMLYFRLKESGRVYVAQTDEKGSAVLMLPKGDSVFLNTRFVPGLSEFHLRKSDYNEKLSLTYHTIGTKAILARQAERARLLAIRDSLYRLERLRDSLAFARDSLRLLAGEGGFLEMLGFGLSAETIKKQVSERAGHEKDMLANDEHYFEHSGEEIKAALYRKRDEWSNKVVVTDLTGSMYPYMDQILLWHALALVPGEQNRYIFFNDGDMQAEADKKLGAAGGIYLTEKMNMDNLLATMKTTMDAGWGGDSPENDLEALLEGVRMMSEMDELILIADNYSDVRDIELLSQLKAPVRIVLAGAEYGVNEDYLEIAYRTGGSIHTLTEDISELSRLADGETITIGGYHYRVDKGKFVQLK
ncbi:MAG: hypothetical protein KDC66_05255 [Phaeodactylibacter sp.]|nr:hypothetical protein [Phaeodactylibacter sp.]MCB9272943.1 hypothetical protein [Lewinellaceae bacterium]